MTFEAAIKALLALNLKFSEGQTVRSARTGRTVATTLDYVLHNCRHRPCYIATGPRGGTYYLAVATQTGSTLVTSGPKGD